MFDVQGFENHKLETDKNEMSAIIYHTVEKKDNKEAKCAPTYREWRKWRIIAETTKNAIHQRWKMQKLDKRRKRYYRNQSLMKDYENDNEANNYATFNDDQTSLITISE